MSNHRNFLTDSILVVFLIAMVFAAIVVSALWYMSPLALGFASHPIDPQSAQWIPVLYKASYFIGIPMLLISQPLALFLAHKGRRTAALLVSLGAALIFGACAGAVLYLVG